MEDKLTWGKWFGIIGSFLVGISLLASPIAPIGVALLIGAAYFAGTITDGSW